MDEQRLFTELGEMRSEIKSTNKGIDILRDDIKPLRTDVRTVKETRVSNASFRWVIGVLSTILMALFGISLKY